MYSRVPGSAREYRDVFELQGVPAFERFYRDGIFVWKQLYRGSYEPWHRVSAPTIENPNAVRQLFRLNAAKAACAELAGLVWGEQCAVRVSGENAEDGDALDGFVQHVLSENGFHEKLQQLIEQGLALGGAAVKVWGEAEGVHLGYAAADQFVPLAWDNERVTEGVFISRATRGAYGYTRLEWHRLEGGRRVIENELYRADVRGGARRDVLGARVPLSEMYPALDERVELPPGDSLFACFRTPVANNLDDDSPLGISIFANALETLHALDICYDSFVSEFRLGKKRIIVPARCVRTVADPATGAMRRYFDPRDEVYEAFAGDDRDELNVKDGSVELRVEEHVAALNAFLGVLCLQLGFSANTFSFDARGGFKTATEVVSENSKTFKTVRTVQNQLTPMLERLVRAIVEVAALSGVAWHGVPVERLAAGGFGVKVTFDDGVTQDRQTNIAEGLRLVEAGLLSKLTFLTDRRYGQGLTEVEALRELERVRQERATEEAETAKREMGDRSPFHQ